MMQASVQLPSVVNFDPYSPRINLDSKRIIAYHNSVIGLKEQINKILREPVENRIFLLRPGVWVMIVFWYLYCCVIACECMHGALKCFTDSRKPVPDEGETSCVSDKQKNKMGKNLIR